MIIKHTSETLDERRWAFEEALLQSLAKLARESHLAVAAPILYHSDKKAKIQVFHDFKDSTSFFMSILTAGKAVDGKPHSDLSTVGTAWGHGFELSMTGLLGQINQIFSQFSGIRIPLGNRSLTFLSVLSCECCSSILTFLVRMRNSSAQCKTSTNQRMATPLVLKFKSRHNSWRYVVWQVSLLST